MATTYTTRAKLRKPGVSDRNWNVPVNENADVLESCNAVGALAVTPAQVPSTSLNVQVGAGPYLTAWGRRDQFAGATLALTDNATNYVYLNSSGVATANTSAFPNSSAHVPLAIVATSGGLVGTIQDQRAPLGMVIPASQPVGGPATAGASYTATEQGMVQKAYDALRALGLLT